MRPLRFLKGCLGRLALILGGFLLTLLLLEMVIRFMLPQQLVLLRPDIFIPTESGIGYRHAPNIDTTINTGEREARLLTDENGYRIGAAAQSPPDYRILAIGDSFLEALQVDYEDSMTALLEQSLSANLGASVSIVNTGMSGYDPNHYLLMTREALAQDRYDMLLVFVYVANDIVSKKVESFPAREPTLRHSFRLPQNFSRGEWVDAVFYPANDWLESNSHLYIFGKNRAEVLLARLGLTARYFPSVMLQSSAESPVWALTADILAEISAEATAYNLPALFVILPASYQVDKDEFERYVALFEIDRDLVNLDQAQQILTAELAARGLLVVDLLWPLRDAYLSGMGDLYGKVDTHFGLNGHIAAAQFLDAPVTELLRGR